MSSFLETVLRSAWLSQLEQQFPTPAFLYQREQLEYDAKRIREALSAASSLYFASFCNSNPWLLRILKNQGFGMLASSPSEYRLAKAIGFPSWRIAVTGAGFSKDDLKELTGDRVELNLDSLDQLADALEVNARATLGIRLNPQFCESTDGKGLPLNSCLAKSSRTGIIPEELPEAVRISKSRGQKLSSVHIYTGTNQLKADLFHFTVQHLFDLVAPYEDIESINIGGGFGFPYLEGEHPFPFRDLNECLRQNIARFEHQHGRTIKVVAEPGRSVIAACGALVTKILHCKIRPNGDTFITTDTNLSNFPRPYIYGDEGKHKVSIVSASSRPTPHPGGAKVVVCGNALPSGDILGVIENFAFVPRAGDYVVIHDTGAYGYAMSSRFSGRLRPAELLLSNENVQLIRKAEDDNLLLEGTGFGWRNSESPFTLDLERRVS